MGGVLLFFEREEQAGGIYVVNSIIIIEFIS